MALITMFTILFLAFGIKGADSEWPQNAVSTAGLTATMRCSSDQRGCSAIEWSKTYTTEAGNPDIIYKNTIFDNFKSKYRVDNSSGCNLVITNVQQDDAGRFTCTAVINKISQERSAFLIVLDSKPTCNVNVSENSITEGDGVSLICAVTSFNGTDKASVIWEDVEAAAFDIRGKTINHSYSVIARAPVVPTYKCAISFNTIMVRDDIATNVPSTSCTTPERSIMYSVRNVKLDPSSSFYTPGTTIRCSADGNPSPTLFTWEEQTNDNWKVMHKGHDFMLSESSSSHYRCAANNTVKGQNFTMYSHTFQVNHTVGIAVGVTFGVVFLLVVIISLVICFFVKSCPLYKRRHSKKYSAGHDRMNDVIYRQPLTQTPSNNTTNGRSSGQGNNPRPPPTSEPPKRPQMPPPQPQPRAHEENHYAEPDEGVQYACLGQEPAIHRNTPHVTEGSEYADITRA